MSEQSSPELRESERKYRMLFENMTAGFALHEMIYDEQGKPLDYRYLEINPAFERLTGVPGKALLGKTVKEVMPGTEQYWIDVFGKVARTGEPAAYQNYASELKRYYDVWAFTPAKDQFAVVFTDITDRKRAEEKLRQKRDALPNARRKQSGRAWCSRRGWPNRLREPGDAIDARSGKRRGNRRPHVPNHFVRRKAGRLADREFEECAAEESARLTRSRSLDCAAADETSSSAGAAFFQDR